nr:transposon TX1 uncharacterized [Tanacetum cinerariifolium]
MCFGVVSCPDIVAMVARDAVALTNRPVYHVKTRRKDGFVSSMDLATRMPDVQDSIEILKQKIIDKGLNDRDFVILSDCKISRIHKGGFSFKFIKKNWDILKDDIISYVQEFDNSAYILRGCNSSFITLILKIDDSLSKGDYRPVSLIGCQYKIIAKVLANHLALVIPSVIGEVQMAYIKGPQIISGPLIVDEIIYLAKKYKKRLDMAAAVADAFDQKPKGPKS